MPNSTLHDPRPELVAAVADAISQAHFGLVALMEAIHGQGAFSSGRRALLLNLRNAPASVPQLAAMRPVSRQYVQKLIDALKLDGLVVASVNPAHKRSPLYRLTKAGRDLVLEMTEREGPSVAQLAAAVEEEMLKRMIVDLRLTRLLIDEALSAQAKTDSASCASLKVN